MVQNSGTLRYFPNLVQAGELEYMGTTIEQIVMDIASKHIKVPGTDVKSLLLDMIVPVLFLLKRRLNLSRFFDGLKMKLYEANDPRKLSQRNLIDIILVNSDRFLSRHRMYLLSKWNPVPMIQPETNRVKDPYRPIASLTHVWDYERPVLLSFGIGSCKGKSQLLNSLFEANLKNQ